MTNRTNLKRGFIIFCIVFSLLLAAVLGYGYSAKKLDLKEIPYNSSDIVSTYELKDYVISKGDSSRGYGFIVTEKNTGCEPYSMELNPLNVSGREYSIYNIKADKERNAIFYIKGNMKKYAIIEKSLDTLAEKELYKSKDYSEEIKLFGITIWHNADSAITIMDNRIRDYLIVDDAIILIKQGTVTIFDGRREKTILEETVKVIANCGNYMYYTNETGELFYMELGDFTPHKIYGANTDKITGTDRGVYFINRLDDNKMYYYDIDSSEMTSRISHN